MACSCPQPFRPSASASVAAGTQSSTVPLGGDGEWLRATNASATTAFIRLGASRMIVASSPGIPIPPGETVLLRLPPSATHVAAVLAAGTGGIFFTRGN